MSGQTKPTIVSLARQLEKAKCDHLMGREVIEKQLVDIAMGKMSNDYCQNWDRCPENGWGNCSPDPKRWAGNMAKSDLSKVFTAQEIKVIAALKIRRM